MRIEFNSNYGSDPCTIKICTDASSISEVTDAVSRALGILADNYRIHTLEQKKLVIFTLVNNSDLTSKLSIYDTAVITIQTMYPKSEYYFPKAIS